MPETAEAELLQPIDEEIETSKRRKAELTKEYERESHRLDCLRSARNSIEAINNFDTPTPEAPEITVQPETGPSQNGNGKVFDEEAIAEWAADGDQLPEADPPAQEPEPVPIDNTEAERDLAVDALEFIGRFYPAGVSTADVARRLDISVPDARLLLKDLVEDKKLVREGERKHTKWIVAGSESQEPIEPPPVAGSPTDPAPEKPPVDRPGSREEWARIEDQVVNTLKASSKPQSAGQLAGTLDLDISIVNTALTALKGQARIHLVRTDNGNKFEPVR